MFLFSLLTCCRTSTPAADVAGAKETPCALGEVFSVNVPIPPPDSAPIKYTTQTQILFALSAVSKAPLRIHPAETGGARPSASLEGKVDIPCAKVAPAAVPSLRKASGLHRYIDVLGLMKKEVFEEGVYQKTRNWQRSTFLIPEHVSELLAALEVGKGGAVYGDWNKELLAKNGWSVEVKRPSRAKARARAIFRHPSMSVALTLEKRDFQGAGDQVKVLETELMIRREKTANLPANYDFFAYGPTGKLEPCAVFFNGRNLVRGPVPHTCMGCHMDYENRRFGPSPMSFRGEEITDWSHPNLALGRLEARTIDSCGD